MMIETLGKWERIQKLASMGFNTPRAMCLPPGSPSAQDMLAFESLLNTAAEDGRAFVNIRTYKRNGVEETWSSVHHTHVPLSGAHIVLMKALDDGYYCMPDAENPENGQYSGNVQLFKDGAYIVEWCYRENGGAMVRNADQSYQGQLGKKPYHGTPDVVWRVAESAYERFTDKYSSVILEWTKGLKPAGVRKASFVWWEFRNIER